MDYSDLTVQAELEELMQQLENTTYIDPAYTESWLRDFTDFVERNKDYDPIDISNEANFIQALDEVDNQQLFYKEKGPFILFSCFQIYLGSGHTHFRADIKMSNASQAQIVGARFLIQGSKIHNAVEEKIFVEQLRAVCDASKYNVTVFHPYFIYFDQVRIMQQKQTLT